MASSSADQAPLPLPRGFITAEDIVDEKVTKGQIVNLIGVVHDCRAPMATAGQDWKMTLRFYDLSIGTARDVTLTIFRPQSKMPEVGAGDVIVIGRAKVQRYRDDPLSLITHYQTTVRVYEASRIAPFPGSARHALRTNTNQPPASTQQLLSTQRAPDEEIEKYISWMYARIDKSCIPEVEQFNLALERSLNVKQKFSLLQDVRDSGFYDFIAQVVKEPYDLGDKITLWVSDYTENSAFYPLLPGENDLYGATTGDPYGYTTKKNQTASSTPRKFNGPIGKRSLQMTCYEPHASLVREQVKIGNWIHFRNIQVKYGSNSNNLEGFLREDMGAFVKKTQVQVLDPHDDPETVDNRLYDTIRRKRDYEKATGKNVKTPAKNEKKRPATENAPAAKVNSKARRKQQREHLKQKHEKQQQQQQQPTANLNSSVKCENPDKPTVTVKEMLQRTTYKTQGPHHEQLEILLPFVCANYRADVRVIDFFPSKLEDFACCRRGTEFDCLPDAEPLSDSDPDSDDGDDESPENKIWEWRFALHLQDAKPGLKKKGTKESVWVVVNNQEAQMLTGLDACDLRGNTEILNHLQEKMFTLWGDLAEVKAESQNQGTQQKTKAKRKPLAQTNSQPPHSSDIEQDEPSGKEKPAQTNGHVAVPRAPSNLPFTCCIRQYGVKATVANEDEADAGDGKRWLRSYGLFGTRISG